MTSNAPDTYYETLIKNYQQTFNVFVGPTEVFVSGATLQLKDYSKTDWLVKNILSKKGWFTPPFPTEEELTGILQQYYTVIDMHVNGSMVFFECVK